jgi:hypothetical protein
MQQFGGKDTKRHFTVVMGGKEHGLYVSSTPSSAAKKAVTKLCAANKSKKVEFSIREITQGSKKKTYGPYSGYIEKLKEPIELKGRVIKYKPVAKLRSKSGAKKGGMKGGGEIVLYNIVDFGTYYSLYLELNGIRYVYRLEYSINDDKNKHYYLFDKTDNKNLGSLFSLQPKFYIHFGDIRRLIREDHIIIIKMTKDSSFQKLININEIPLQPSISYSVNNSSYINNNM